MEGTNTAENGHNGSINGQQNHFEEKYTFKGAGPAGNTSRETFKGSLKNTAIEPIRKYSNSKDLEAFILFLSALHIVLSRYTPGRAVVVEAPSLSASAGGSKAVPLVSVYEGTLDLKSFFIKTNEQALNSFRQKQAAWTKGGGTTNVLVYHSNLHTTSPETLAAYDIAIDLTEALSGIVSVHYAAPAIREWQANNLIGHLSNTLSAYSDLTVKLADIQVVSEKEKEQLSVSFNDTKRDFPADKTLVSLFEAKANEYPDREAVRYLDQSLSYREFNEKSNRLAHHLITSEGVKKGDFVGVCLDKSEMAPLAFMAILKAGAIYVPLPVKAPKQRLQGMLDETSIKSIVTQSDYLYDFAETGTSLTALDVQLDGLDTSAANPGIALQGEDRAYIIYTSGSTGTPKGVVVRHRGMVNLLFDHISAFSITPEDRILQFFALTFDASILDMIMALGSGASLVIPSQDMLGRKEDFVSYLDQTGTTLITLTPSFLRTLDQADMPSVRVLITGGEAVNEKDVAFYAANKQYVNAYGPSETTVNATLHFVDGTEDIVPIGKPRSNKQLYIVGEDRSLLPAGVAGELCIAGEGLAEGYLDNPELTAAKFVDNPFAEGKMYRTGDLAMWQPDGTILFKGRTDEQLKIRGFRVEPGEIAGALASHPKVKEAVVLPTEAEAEEKELVGFYTPATPIEIVPSSGEYFIYDPFIYESMATDDMRVSGYQGACRGTVEGKVVMDPGTGSEMILARHCVAAGAKKVYAIEIEKTTYDKAKENLEAWGLQDKIELIYGDAGNVELPEKVDVVISALAGNVTGTDGAITIVNNIKKNLPEDVTFIPNRYFTKIGAIHLPEEDFGYKMSGISKYYVDEVFKKYGYKFDLRMCLRYFSADRLMTDYADFEVIFYNDDMEVDEERQLTLNVTKEGKIHGFALWINAMFFDHMVIDSLQETHHLPVYFPVFPEGVSVRSGDTITMQVTRSLSDDELTPDYVIKGEIVRTNGETVPYTYESYNHKKAFREDTFYQRLFDENGNVDLLPEDTEENLKLHLSARVPEYMVPNRIHKLDSLPLTRNDKVDRKALLKADAEMVNSEKAYVAPETDMQKELAGIWQEVLNKDKIGIRDNFFSLGGNSLKATQLVSRLEDHYEVAVELTDVFSNASVETLAEHMQAVIHAANSENGGANDKDIEEVLI
ncbi:amino acid adenylation domain-containing protein [Roseivirga sp. BDSF3-8]|uniref:amino acid adenylation domain-containing protein n=1 Tax=Roseivirga sp. BDSF3-8 TaxID=3241598 RepID=UPI003531BAF2